MDNPRDETVIDAYRKSGAFTVGAVYADTETRGMEAEFEKAHLELKALGRKEEDLEEELQRLSAILICADRTCDRILREFELGLFALVQKKRADPRYGRYFAGGLREVTEADMRKVEPKMVRTILATMEEDKDKPDLKPLVERFQSPMLASVEAVEGAGETLTKGEDNLKFLQEKTIPAAKQEWRAKRTQLNAALTAKFPLDSDRVDSYFKRFAKPRDKAKSKPDLLLDPTPGTGNTDPNDPGTDK
jgi:hypothetical protein